MSTVLTLGFPVYAVEACEETSRVIIAGGGGPAKSGVRNAIVIYILFDRLVILSLIDFIPHSGRGLT